MALADEMRRLTQRLGEDHDGRTAAVAGIRTAVARELSEFRTDRQAEAEAQGQRLRVFMGDLDKQTAALLAGFGAARESMSGEQQRKLAGDIGALRQSMDALLDEWNTMRRAMAQGQREWLSEHRDALFKDTTALRDRLGAAYQAMSSEQQQSLGRYMFDMRGQVDQLLKDFDQAIQSMANEQRQRLARENQSFKDEVGVERQLIIADQAEARQVWGRYSELMRQRGARKPQATLQAPEPLAQEKKSLNRRYA